MTGIRLAIVVAAFLIVIASLWLAMRRRRRAGETIDDPAQAAEVAERVIPGFRPTGALIGEDRAAALVAGENGRVALVKRRGVRLAAREVRWGQVRATAGGMLVETGDWRFGAVMVSGIDVIDVRRLGLSLGSA